MHAAATIARLLEDAAQRGFLAVAEARTMAAASARAASTHLLELAHNLYVTATAPNSLLVNLHGVHAGQQHGHSHHRMLIRRHCTAWLPCCG